MTFFVFILIIYLSARLHGTLSKEGTDMPQYTKEESREGRRVFYVTMVGATVLTSFLPAGWGYGLALKTAFRSNRLKRWLETSVL